MEEYRKRVLTASKCRDSYSIGIIGVALYVKAFLAGDRSMITVAICVVAFSGLFNGMLAGRLNQYSELGAALDPLRD